jgi:hypothetical protein
VTRPLDPGASSIIRLRLDTVCKDVDLSIVSATMIVLQRPVEQIAALGCEIFENLLWRRLTLMERADFVGAAMG